MEKPCPRTVNQHKGKEEYAARQFRIGLENVDPADYEGKKALYALIQQMGGEFEEREGSLICRELLGLRKGEDIGEPAVRTEEYYRSRPCIGACRTAAEIAEKYLALQENAETE